MSSPLPPQPDPGTGDDAATSDTAPAGAVTEARPPTTPTPNSGFEVAGDPEATSSRDYSCLPVYSLQNRSRPTWHTNLPQDRFQRVDTDRTGPRELTSRLLVNKVRKAIGEIKEKYPTGVNFLHTYDLEKANLELLSLHNSFQGIPHTVYFVDSIGKLTAKAFRN